MIVRCGAPCAVVMALLTGACAGAPVMRTLGDQSGPAWVEVEVGVSARGPRRVPREGTLIVGWLGDDQARAMGDGRFLPRLMEIVSGSVLIRGARVGTGAPPVSLRLPCPAGARGQVYAIFDTQGAYFPTLFGGGPEENLRGRSITMETPPRGEIGAAVLSLRPVKRKRSSRSRPERCVGPRFRALPLPGPLGAPRSGPTGRRLCAYLPRGYDVEPERRFPVVYLLPGLGGGETSYFSPGKALHALADRLGRETGQGVILVGVDTRTAVGSSYLVDSPLTGAWERHVLGGIVPLVDGRLRTRAAGTSRALLGTSTGGFNAVSFGLRHPATFSVVAALVPDGLDLAHWLLDPAGRLARPWLAEVRLEDALGGRGQMASYAADWSPAPGRGHGFLWPVDPSTGALRPRVWSRWLAHSPSRLLDRPDVAAAARTHLARRLWIGAAPGDDFGLFAPAKRFSVKLRRLGIDHRFVELEGGHADRASQRLSLALRFVLQRFAGR